MSWFVFEPINPDPVPFPPPVLPHASFQRPAHPCESLKFDHSRSTVVSAGGSELAVPSMRQYLLDKEEELLTVNELENRFINTNVLWLEEVEKHVKRKELSPADYLGSHKIYHLLSAYSSYNISIVQLVYQNNYFVAQATLTLQHRHCECLYTKSE